jgi:hypothetical protein
VGAVEGLVDRPQHGVAVASGLIALFIWVLLDVVRFRSAGSMTAPLEAELLPGFRQVFKLRLPF